MKRLFLFLTLCLLMGCSELTEGIVVDKNYTGARTTVSTTYIKSGSTFIPVSVPISYPEQYSIKVQGYNKKGHLIRESWKITFFQWERVYEGQKASRNGDTVTLW
ncbi:MAG: hypothetical protein FWC21_06660 [Treponema sp.]|nr:hypothetical protein [Treponema sp.]